MTKVCNREERIFYLVQVEILAESAPMIGGMARAHAASVDGDWEALAGELVILSDTLRRVTSCFLKIDPNPSSDTFVDPVVWAKTVAPFAVQIRKDSHAISGAAAPLFQLLDVFLGRRKYESLVGREAHSLRPGFSPNLRAFLAALDTVSVADAVAKSGRPKLEGLWRSMIDAYVGPQGFLALHRRKAFAYLELAFKVGRSVTTGGFTGVFDDQTWEVAHHELELSRQERLDVPVTGCPMAHPHAQSRGDLTSPGLAHVVVDVSATGLRYRPGDRLAVLPESDPHLIEFTLRALGAEARQAVRLDARWLAALKALGESATRTSIPLGELLARGHIRPVSREAAKALLHISGSQALARIVNARAEATWDLWDLLELVAEGGFDTRTLWRAEPWEPYAIAKLIPPEHHRFFSIASAMSPEETHTAERAELLVAELAYRTETSEVSREEVRVGTASSFMRRWVDGDRTAAPVRIAPATRFGPPDDPDTPIVLFAGGAGVAPFRAFISARAARETPGLTSLFLSTRSEAHLALYRRDFACHVAAGWLQFHPVVGSGAGEPVRSKGIARLIEEHADALLRLARAPSDGGAGAVFYVCGAAAFAATVMHALETAFAHALGTADPGTDARNLMRKMIGTHRYRQDVFSARNRGARDLPLLDASEVASHNDEVHGHWMILEGSVYDVSEFAHRHAGGLAIVLEHTGRDATRAYRTIEHHLDPEIEAMLGMYEIGKIRRLELGSAWSVAVGPKGLRFISLAEAFRAWVRMLHLVVEVENAVRHDFAILDSVTVAGDAPGDMTVLKARLLLEAHQRFVDVYLASLLGEPLDNVWSIAASFGAAGDDTRRLRRELEEIAFDADARSAQEGLANAWTFVLSPGAGPNLGTITELWRSLENADLRMLRELKRAIAGALRQFERWERETIERAGESLVTTLLDLPPLRASLNREVRRAFDDWATTAVGSVANASVDALTSEVRLTR